MGTLKVDTIQDSGGNTILSSDGSGGFTNSLPAGKTSSFRNLIINGDMSIAQRGTSVSSITSSGYRTMDRWNFATDLGTWTMSQETDVPTGQGFAKSLKLDCTTANASPSAGNFLVLEQKIEGQMLQHLKKGTSNAESLTMSFWVKSSKTGTYICELLDTDNSRQISKAYTINSANTWEKKTLTYEGDTTGAFTNDNNESLRIDFWLGAGSTFTGGTLSTTWTATSNGDRVAGSVNLADSTSNDWYITGVQLEVGTTASDFEFIPYDVNLRRCQRYFQFMGGVASGFPMMQVYGISGSDMRTPLSFPTTMRASPTATVSGTWQTLNTANPTFDFLSPEGCCMKLDVSGGSGQTYAHPNSTDDYVTFDSEL